mgnify:CR=1 FL=1
MHQQRSETLRTVRVPLLHPSCRSMLSGKRSAPYQVHLLRLDKCPRWLALVDKRGTDCTLNCQSHALTAPGSFCWRGIEITEHGSSEMAEIGALVAMVSGAMVGWLAPTYR